MRSGCAPAAQPPSRGGEGFGQPRVKEWFSRPAVVGGRGGPMSYREPAVNAAPPTRRGLRARRVAAWILGPVLAVVAWPSRASRSGCASRARRVRHGARPRLRARHPGDPRRGRGLHPARRLGRAQPRVLAPRCACTSSRGRSSATSWSAPRAARGRRSDETEAGLRDGASRRHVLRTLRFALGGAALLALVLGLGLAAFGVRRRRVLVGAPVGRPRRSPPIACAATIFQAQASFDERALERPTYYARGAELVQLLDAAANAREAGDGYASKVQGAVSGFASLLADPTAGRARRHAARAARLRPAQQPRRARLAAATTPATSPCSSSATSATPAAARRSARSATGSRGSARGSSRSRATTTRRPSCAAWRAAA